MKLWLVALLALLLAACSSSPTNDNSGRYQYDDDFHPPAAADNGGEPVPRSEPLAVNGNGPTYRVNGKRYKVINPQTGYKEKGIASWYGMKFHGHATASGESYDVYKYTAAHKTLSIPSYVRVTRQDNGKSVVVRVNDRGPFHDGRIIDLSYAAAKKIGLDIAGTAPVTVELLKGPQSGKVYWLQVNAFSDARAAEKQRDQVRQILAPLEWPVEIHSSQKNGRAIHRVRIGPVPEGKPLKEVVRKLEDNDIDNAIILTEPSL